MKSSSKKNLILVAILATPGLAFAQAVPPSPITITGMVVAAVNTALFIASGIVVILWVVTGILFLQAQGAPDKLSTAKKALIAAVAGTLLVIIASSALSLVRSAFNV